MFCWRRSRSAFLLAFGVVSVKQLSVALDFGVLHSGWVGKVYIILDKMFFL